MKSSVVAALGCLAGSALGHGQIQNFTLNGAYNQGFIRMSPFLLWLPNSFMGNA